MMTGNHRNGRQAHAGRAAGRGGSQYRGGSDQIFRGTLLGTGGLVRAYSRAVQEGLKSSVVIEKQQGYLLKMQTDYNGVGENSVSAWAK